MNKNILRFLVILGIVFVVFNVIAFVVPFTMIGSFWVGYIFGIIAIAYQLYAFKVAFADGEGAKSKFYGFPIAKIGAAYLAAQLIIAFIEMAASTVLPVWVAVVINVVILGVAAVGCISAEVVKDEVIHQDIKVTKDINNMSELKSLSASLISLSNDAEVKAILQDLADEFRYSDPVTSDATAELEKNLKTILGDIKLSLVDKNIDSVKENCSKAKLELAERNRICKLGKRV